MSFHPISDKAEVSDDFPDKAYIGSFGRHSQFDAYADEDSVAVRAGATWGGSTRGSDAFALRALGGHSCRACEITGLSSSARRAAPKRAERGRKAALEVFGAALRELTPSTILV
jgi:hypothetical protein